MAGLGATMVTLYEVSCRRCGCCSFISYTSAVELFSVPSFLALFPCPWSLSQSGISLAKQTKQVFLHDARSEYRLTVVLFSYD
jgi:hypothetical protein